MTIPRLLKLILTSKMSFTLVLKTTNLLRVSTVTWRNSKSSLNIMAMHSSKMSFSGCTVTTLTMIRIWSLIGNSVKLILPLTFSIQSMTTPRMEINWLTLLSPMLTIQPLSLTAQLDLTFVFSMMWHCVEALIMRKHILM
jgi:hypothetical protein